MTIKFVPVNELRKGEDVRPGGGVIIDIQPSKSGKTVLITDTMIGAERLNAKAKIAVCRPGPVRDYRTEAATVQGLDAMHDRLTREGIVHEVNDTGGATMKIQIPMADGGVIDVDRGDQWTGDVNDPDEWAIIRYASGELGADFTDLGFDLSMDATVTIIRCQIDGD